MDIAVDIPNINKAMTKKEQAVAIFNEVMACVTIFKDETSHTEKQKLEAKDSIAHYFPDLALELKGI